MARSGPGRGGVRDHYPRCYSMVFAGGGVRGGQIYGKSGRHASIPVESPCGPNDIHATIFHALGIPIESSLQDTLARPLPITDGKPLPLFG